MKLWRRLSVCLIVCLTTLNNYAQVAVINGRVINRTTGRSLPYVNVWLSGHTLGTSTNIDGIFELRLPVQLIDSTKKISLSCIGYETRELLLSSVRNRQNLIVELNPSTTKLAEIVVHSDKYKKKLENQARKIVLKAISRIPRNYPSDNFTLHTFYRHYCAENDTYVRLIESAIDVNNIRGNMGFVEIPKEKLAFGLRQLRRSFDFKENARIYHPPISLNFLLCNDITSFRYHNPIMEGLGNYTLSISDTTRLGNDEVYVIDFDKTHFDGLVDDIHYAGQLFILKKNYAIVRADVFESKGKYNLSDSVYTYNQRIVLYREVNSKYYLDRLSSDLSVHQYLLDHERNIVDSLIHTSHIELISNDITIEPTGQFQNTELDRSGLLDIKYDSTFWNSYTVLKATELEQKIINDLSQKVSLDRQYEAFNKIENGGISVLQSNEFSALIEKYRGVPLYVILWLDPSRMNILELEPTPYFKRKIRKDKIKLLFVGLDDDHENWLNQRQFYGLNNGFNMHERLNYGFDEEILKEYLNNSFPYYVFINKDGRPENLDLPLPSYDRIRQYIKPHLKKRK